MKNLPQIGNLEARAPKSLRLGYLRTMYFQEEAISFGKEINGTLSSLWVMELKERIHFTFFFSPFPWEQLGFPQNIPFSWSRLFWHHLYFTCFALGRRAPETARPLPSSAHEMQTACTCKHGAVHWAVSLGKATREPAGICTCGDIKSNQRWLRTSPLRAFAQLSLWRDDAIGTVQHYPIPSSFKAQVRSCGKCSGNDTTHHTI